MEDSSGFSLVDVAKKIQAERGSKSVVLVSGTYDLLHRGHIKCLQAVSKQGDILVVGINSDERVRTRKGHRRPIIPEKDRAFVVQGIRGVDYVFIKRDPFTSSAIEQIKPNVLVFSSDKDKLESHKKMGEEYQKSFPELKVVFLPREGKGTSTSRIESEIVKRAQLYE